RQEVRQYQVVPPRFKQVIYQLVDFLLGLQCHLSELNHIYSKKSGAEIEKCKNAISNEISDLFQKRLPPFFNAMAEAIQGVSGTIQKSSLQYLRTKLKQLIYHGDSPSTFIMEVVDDKPPSPSIRRHSQHLMSDCLRYYFRQCI